MHVVERAADKDADGLPRDGHLLKSISFVTRVNHGYHNQMFEHHAFHNVFVKSGFAISSSSK